MTYRITRKSHEIARNEGSRIVRFRVISWIVFVFSVTSRLLILNAFRQNSLATRLRSTLEIASKVIWLWCVTPTATSRVSLASSEVQEPVRLKNRALLPGLVNAHSHAFQRVIRGRTEYRTSNEKDSFWTWREMMYSAATRLTPEDIYDASRMAFLEMALSGITAVGEFHYLHNQPDGTPYDDPESAR